MKRVYNILSIIFAVAFLFGTLNGVDVMAFGFASLVLYCLHLESRIKAIEELQ